MGEKVICAVSYETEPREYRYRGDVCRTGIIDLFIESEISAVVRKYRSMQIETFAYDALYCPKL